MNWKTGSIILAGVVVFIGCAGTGHRPPRADKIEYNQAYFDEVKAHFDKNGTSISAEELMDYKASVFIATVPPVADVYDDSLYMGKSNSVLYFKPGNRHIKCIKGNKKVEEDIILLEGKNGSLFMVLK
jgi:hypothetical protein